MTVTNNSKYHLDGHDESHKYFSPLKLSKSLNNFMTFLLVEFFAPKLELACHWNPCAAIANDLYKHVKIPVIVIIKSHT